MNLPNNDVEKNDSGDDAAFDVIVNTKAQSHGDEEHL